MNKSALLLLIFGIALGIFVFFKFLHREPAPEDTPPIVPVDTTPQIPALEPQAGLPPEVEAKRQALYHYAMAGDYDALSQEIGTPFMYSFGADDRNGFASFLRSAEQSEGKGAQEIIPTLLRLPFALQGDIYVWPSVFTKSAAEWTEEDIALMKTFLSNVQIQQYREFGAYIYYRIGIKEDGTWIYYLAGD